MICEELLENKNDSAYIICPQKNCGQYFCEDCVAQQSLTSDRFLEPGESVYSASFVSMIKDQTRKPPQPLEDINKIATLFDSVQIVYALQVVIFLLLVTSNWNRELFVAPTPSFFIMRMVCAFLFHIFALDDSRSAYQNLKFLIRYPERFEAQLRLSAFIICIE